VREGARVWWCPEASSRGEAKQPRRRAGRRQESCPDPLTANRECRAPAPASAIRGLALDAAASFILFCRSRHN
jgi:hypothetical protein